MLIVWESKAKTSTTTKRRRIQCLFHELSKIMQTKGSRRIFVSRIDEVRHFILISLKSQLFAKPRIFRTNEIAEFNRTTKYAKKQKKQMRRREEQREKNWFKVNVLCITFSCLHMLLYSVSLFTGLCIQAKLYRSLVPCILYPSEIDAIVRFNIRASLSCWLWVCELLMPFQHFVCVYAFCNAVYASYPWSYGRFFFLSFIARLSSFFTVFHFGFRCRSAANQCAFHTTHETPYTHTGGHKNRIAERSMPTVVVLVQCLFLWFPLNFEIGFQSVVSSESMHTDHIQCAREFLARAPNALTFTASRGVSSAEKSIKHKNKR